MGTAQKQSIYLFSNKGCRYSVTAPLYLSAIHLPPLSTKGTRRGAL